MQWTSWAQWHTLYPMVCSGLCACYGRGLPRDSAGYVAMTSVIDATSEKPNIVMMYPAYSMWLTSRFSCGRFVGYGS